MFSLDAVAGKAFVIWTGVPIRTLILGTFFRPFQAFLKTSLDGRQWLICTRVALTIVAVAEIRKAVRPRARGRDRAESPSEG
jgi:hypothetical protein